jgi:hypothetical protein
MGLFSFFNRKNGSANHMDGADAAAQTLSENPQGVFFEKDKPLNGASAPNNNASPSQQGINLLFQFLEKNYEKKGYDDALINPDSTHLEQNIAALKNELQRTIRKVKTFYEDFIREINFHISSRTRSGMIDTVEELNAKKETAESHIRQVLEIEQEANESRGVAEGIVLSYTRGFRNGLAAISHHSIMNKNF